MERNTTKMEEKKKYIWQADNIYLKIDFSFFEFWILKLAGIILKIALSQHLEKQSLDLQSFWHSQRVASR